MMRAGDTKQRRRAPQQQTLPMSSSPVSSAVTPRKRRGKRESTSPMVILSVVMIGTSLIFLIASKVIKAQRKAANRLPSPEIRTGNINIADALPTQEEQSNRILPLQKDEGDVESSRKVVVTDDTDATEADQTEAPTSSPHEQVMALLYPPGLMGGYRNQVIRLLSLVVTATKRKIHRLLLPSLLWTTQVIVEDGTEKWVPIPHDLVFDVEYWNTFHTLPRLTGDTSSLECWTHDLPQPPANATQLQKAVLARGFLKPIANLSKLLTTREMVVNLRKLDVYSNVSECQSPSVYGGGTGAGRLWRDYINTQNRNLKHNSTTSQFNDLDSKILQALRPKQEWRDLAMSCAPSTYVALHARMELEMMDHPCGRDMERNLTRLFGHVEALVDDLQDVGSVFVAVSRSGIEIREGNLYEKFKTYADENLATLNRVVGDSQGSVGQGLRSDTVVFECGKHLMDKYYSEHPGSMDYGSLLQSVVNFYIATEAKAFIGVRGSSYSTDIWTTRYHLGKGETNYEYTKNGIFKLPNGGLPPMHTNCGKKK